MDLFSELQPPLESIKSLAGSPPPTLAFIQRRVARILKLVSGIVPPEEVAAAHALLVSAVQLAGNAAEIRREAVLAGDMTRAWDASSAAAGALMLAARARADIQSAAAAATTQVITPRRTQLVRVSRSARFPAHAIRQRSVGRVQVREPASDSQSVVVPDARRRARACSATLARARRVDGERIVDARRALRSSSRAAGRTRRAA